MFNQSIVKMDESHIAELAGLEAVCFSAPWPAGSLASELDNPQAVFFVSVINRRVAGYAGMHDILGEGYVTNVAVFPEFRRHGVGTALMNALLDYGHLHDLTFITLEVRPGNSAAISLYERLGFERAGIRKDFYIKPSEDGLIMTRFFM